MAANPKPPKNAGLEKRIAEREATLEDRINAYNDILDKRAAKYAKEIAPTWKRVERDLAAAIKDVYAKYTKPDGTLDPAKLNEVNRLKILQDQAKVLNKASQGQTSKLTNNLAYTYSDSYYFTAFQMQDVLPAVNIAAPLLTHGAVMGVIANPWLPDGKTYSDRLRANTAYLGLKMREAVEQAVGRGWDINTAARRIKDIAGEGYFNSVRLARTEINRAAGQASSHVFMQNADILDGKRWNATLDSKTAPKDAANDRKTYDLEYDTPEMPGRPGERIPNHPHCRCKWTPILASLGSREGERIARDAAGKNYYTKAKDYKAYAKERGIDLDERLRNDDPRRYLRRGETLEGANTLPGVVKAASGAAAASAAAPWVAQVGSLISSGVDTEVKAREVGDLVRQEIEKQIGDKAPALQLRVSELTDEASALYEEIKELQNKAYALPYDIPNRKALFDEIDGQVKPKAAELGKTRQALTEANTALRRLRQEAAIDVLSQVRPMGSTKSHSWYKGSQAKAKDALQQAQKFYPTDWLENSHTFNSLEAKVIGRGFYRDGAQGGKSDFRISGRTETDLTRVAVHELGHRFEHIKPEIRKLEKQFYDRRTAGEGLKWLGKGYDAKEKARFDQFLHPYMGKDYGNKETSYFEILSMGTESVFMGSFQIDKDVDYYNFVLGVLAGL